jgi:hypothetical protein
MSWLGIASPRHRDGICGRLEIADGVCADRTHAVYPDCRTESSWGVGGMAPRDVIRMT